MANNDRHEVQIYQLRAVRGISPLIWKRLLVRSDSTVAGSQIMLLDRKPRAASATQGFRLSAAQTVSSSDSTSFGFLVSGFGRSGCGLGRGRSITDFGSSPVRAFFFAHCEKNRSS
jgi:hypothetical protein